MNRPARVPRTIAILATALLVAAGVLSLATPVRTAAAQTGDVDVVATGLVNPRGLAFGLDGSLYVAEAGRGGAHLVQAGYGQVQYLIGTTAKVTRISYTGHMVTILPHLPSVEARGDIYGAAGVAFIGDNLY